MNDFICVINLLEWSWKWNKVQYEEAISVSGQLPDPISYLCDVWGFSLEL